MLVCHCKRVNSKVIRDCVQSGARNAKDVGAACGAGECCGGCLPLVEELVDRELGSTGTLDGLPMAPQE